MTRPQKFRVIAEEIAKLYEMKDKAYGNSFGSTYEKLGIISAVTRISDKYNRLCNLATNADVDNLGESIEDTLKDMVAYGIMTLMEIKKAKPLVIEPKNVDSIAGFKVGDEVQEVLSDLIRRDRKIKEIIPIFLGINCRKKSDAQVFCRLGGGKVLGGGSGGHG